MTDNTENLIAAVVDDAEEMQGPVVETAQPRLLIENCDPDRTVSALCDILSDAGSLYDRGVPVRLAFDQIQGGTVAHVMTPDALVLMAHTDESGHACSGKLGLARRMAAAAAERHRGRA